MDDLRSLRTKVDRKKRPFCRRRYQPVPESPPEPLQCEHYLGNFNQNLTFWRKPNFPDYWENELILLGLFPQIHPFLDPYPDPFSDPLKKLNNFLRHPKRRWADVEGMQTSIWFY